MIISKNIEIDIDECELTIKELRKLRNKYYDKKDYDTVKKRNSEKLECFQKTVGLCGKCMI